MYLQMVAIYREITVLETLYLYSMFGKNQVTTSSSFSRMTSALGTCIQSMLEKDMIVSFFFMVITQTHVQTVSTVH